MNCQICGTEVGKMLFYCPSCEMDFCCRGHLMDHLLVVHNINDDEEDSIKNAIRN